MSSSGRKMGDDCRGCRNWEEEIYWSRFQSVQFFQTLSGGRYHQELAIPQKFTNNLREKLAGTVSLKGPSGVQWKVGLTASDDTLYFKDGWKEFVEDHSLVENDVLVFKYIGESRFDVLMFDRESLCEKEGSYFIRRCENAEADGGKTKGNPLESIEISNESSDDVVKCAPPKRPRTRRDDDWRPRSRVRAPQTNGGIRRGAKSKQSSACGLGLSSHRRQVTEEEKEKAVELARAAASGCSFITVMRPSHVSNGFYMSIPTEWATKHLPQNRRDMMLQVKEKTWQVTFQRRGQGNGGLAGGWKKFAIENSLQEFDVCLFKLVSKKTDALIMDVSIFRVAEDVIPGSEVPSVSEMVKN